MLGVDSLEGRLGFMVHTVLVRPSGIRKGHPRFLQSVVARGKEEPHCLCALVDGRCHV